MPVGKPLASTAAPQGLPVGKPLQPAAPQGVPVGKPLQGQAAPQSPPVGKPAPAQNPPRGRPVQPAAPQGVPTGKPVQPQQPAPAPAQNAAPAAAAKAPAAPRPAARPKPAPTPQSPARPASATPSGATQSDAAPPAAAPRGKPAPKPSAESRREPAPEVDDLADLVPAGGAAADAMSLDPFGGEFLGAEVAPVGRHCPKCLTKLAEDSNICPACGRDATEIEPTLQDLPAELPAAVARASGRGGGALRTVRLGLRAVCAAQGLVMVAVILQLLGTMADEPLNLAPPASSLTLVAVSAVGLGFLSTALASVLCLVVPGRARARALLFGKVACDAGAAALAVAWYQNQVPEMAALAIVALEVLAIVLFILFMRQLARYLEKADDAARVLRLLWKTLAVAGGVGLFAQFSAMIGSKTFLLARVIGLLGWAFVLFQFTLLAQELAAAARLGPPSPEPAGDPPTTEPERDLPAAAPPA